MTTLNRFGDLLREWRDAAGFSQLDLGLEANVSARHISFVETGRARPSQGLILRLADALGMPFRDRNVLLLAAGFAPVYSERPLDDPEMTPVHHALGLILESHRYPAFVLNRAWDVIQANPAFEYLLSLSFPDGAPEPINAMRLVFHPDQLRPFIRNWDVVASVLLARLRERQRLPTSDTSVRDLYEEIRRLPGVDALPGKDELRPEHAFLIPMEIVIGDQMFSWFSTIAAIGSPLDVTLEELQIESLFPANRETEEIVNGLIQKRTRTRRRY